jgi:hypothetical protein
MFNKKEYDKKWREEHREYDKKYCEEHKDEKKKNDLKWKKNNPWSVTFQHIKVRCTNSNHKQFNEYKNRLGDITAEELKEIWIRDRAYEMDRPEIDRIDNDGVYTKSNLQYIEKTDHIIKTAQERKLKKLGVKL